MWRERAETGERIRTHCEATESLPSTIAKILSRKLRNIFLMLILSFHLGAHFFLQLHIPTPLFTLQPSLLVVQLTYCPAGFFKGKSYLLLFFVLKEDPFLLQALPPWIWLPWKVLVFIVIFQEDTDQVCLVKLLRHT